ncbi:MAG TPA: hypothetical protein VEJ39_09355 [Candidatus Acidoferrales bacterium]|nr:hypothetical protein [Candidatus Acidoferrales bacterium]
MSGPPSLFGETHEAKPPAAPPADYIQPNLGHGLRIWWAFYWPVFLASSAFAIAFNVVVRRFLEDPRVPMGAVFPFFKYQQLFIALFYMAISFPAFAYILRKRFRHFRIGLLSNYGQGAERLSPTFLRTASVWWAYSWRVVVYRLLAMVIIMFPLGWILGFAAAFLPHSASILFSKLFVPIVIDALVGMYVIYASILDENISNFRVGLVPVQAAAIAPLTPTASLPETGIQGTSA